jgi:hypothetical protein
MLGDEGVPPGGMRIATQEIPGVEPEHLCRAGDFFLSVIETLAAARVAGKDVSLIVACAVEADEGVKHRGLLLGNNRLNAFLLQDLCRQLTGSAEVGRKGGGE